jgi:hypothetical protein
MSYGFDLDKIAIEILKQCYDEAFVNCDDIDDEAGTYTEQLRMNQYLSPYYSNDSANRAIYDAVAITLKGKKAVEDFIAKERENSLQNVSVMLTKEANELSEKSNQIAKVANKKSNVANLISLFALVAAIVAIVLSIIC